MFVCYSDFPKYSLGIICCENPCLTYDVSVHIKWIICKIFTLIQMFLFFFFQIITCYIIAIVVQAGMSY